MKKLTQREKEFTHWKVQLKKWGMPKRLLTTTLISWDWPNTTILISINTNSIRLEFWEDLWKLVRKNKAKHLIWCWMRTSRIRKLWSKMISTSISRTPVRRMMRTLHFEIFWVKPKYPNLILIFLMYLKTLYFFIVILYVAF
jgi:hypothetical protein